MTDWRATLPAPRPPPPKAELIAAAQPSHINLKDRNMHAHLCIIAGRLELAQTHMAKIPRGWDRDVVAECLRQIADATSEIASANNLLIVRDEN